MFLRLSKIFLPVSIVLMVGSLVLLVTPGLRAGVEFSGGTLMELQIPETKTKDDVLMALRSFDNPDVSIDHASVTRTKDGTYFGTYFVRTETLTNEEHTSLVKHV